MAMEKSERYTMIGIDEDSKKAQIITFIRADLNRLEKLCKQYPKSYQHASDQLDDDGVTIIGKEFVCDKKLVLFKAPSSRKLTEEEKKIQGERLQKARTKKINGK
jgi:DNA-directed RNA polymerase beta subunit